MCGEIYTGDFFDNNNIVQGLNASVFLISYKEQYHTQNSIINNSSVDRNLYGRTERGYYCPLMYIYV